MACLGPASFLLRWFGADKIRHRTHDFAATCTVRMFVSLVIRLHRVYYVLAVSLLVNACSAFGVVLKSHTSDSMQCCSFQVEASCCSFVVKRFEGIVEGSSACMVHAVLYSYWRDPEYSHFYESDSLQ